MSDTNPYAHSQGSVSAADAAVEERAAFLRRTYSWLLAGILVWSATMYAGAQVESVQRIAFAVFGKWWVATAFLIGGGMAVRALSTKAIIGPAFYLVYAIGFGLLVTPLVAYASLTGSMDLVAQAAVTTAMIFVGLTAYVFISGKDFSFMGGALSILSMAVLALIVVGMLFGFQFGIWLTVGIALLYSMFLLYDTSQILHRFPTHMHIAAAANLFASVVLLFYHILIMFLHSDD